MYADWNFQDNKIQPERAHDNSQPHLVPPDIRQKRNETAHGPVTEPQRQPKEIGLALRCHWMLDVLNFYPFPRQQPVYSVRLCASHHKRCCSGVFHIHLQAIGTSAVKFHRSPMVEISQIMWICFVSGMHMPITESTNVPRWTLASRRVCNAPFFHTPIPSNRHEPPRLPTRNKIPSDRTSQSGMICCSQSAPCCARYCCNQSGNVVSALSSAQKCCMTELLTSLMCNV